MNIMKVRKLNKNTKRIKSKSLKFFFGILSTKSMIGISNKTVNSIQLNSFFYHTLNFVKSET